MQIFFSSWIDLKGLWVCPCFRYITSSPKGSPCPQQTIYVSPTNNLCFPTRKYLTLGNVNPPHQQKMLPEGTSPLFEACPLPLPRDFHLLPKANLFSSPNKHLCSMGFSYIQHNNTIVILAYTIFKDEIFIQDLPRELPSYVHVCTLQLVKLQGLWISKSCMMLV
jgi:hypothetical protein